ncbi:uncharacterized protein [Pleurodeles waltl]|uniref:uncharacterized protein n=1 Tax=Pleurodeles waltl TaxID=8319 RepID=UPI003709A8A1
MMKTPGAILLLAVLLGSYKALPVEEENLPEVDSDLTSSEELGNKADKWVRTRVNRKVHTGGDKDCKKKDGGEFQVSSPGSTISLGRTKEDTAVDSDLTSSEELGNKADKWVRTRVNRKVHTGGDKDCKKKDGGEFQVSSPGSTISLGRTKEDTADAPHPGTCPKILAACKLPLPPPQCQSDTDCLKTQKCCNLCRKRCVSAVRVDSDLTSSEELGNKADKWVRTRVNRKVHTGGDKDCKKKDGGEFQVSSPGSTISLGRTKEDTADAPHPGTCPKILAACKLPLPPPQCQSDTDCLKTQKCCNLCRKRCVSAVRVDSDLTSSEELGNKADKWVRTRVNRKVHTGGDKDCKKKDGGEFQVSSTGSTISLGRTKEDTADAPHPGTCLKIQAACNLPLPPPECHSDTDCPKTDKCCNLCGKICVSAVRDSSIPA